MGKTITRIILLALIMTLTVPSSSVFATGSKAKAKKNKTHIVKANSPSTLKAGKDYSVKGKIKSNYKIKRVEIGVTTKGGGKWTAQKYDNKKVNAKTFNVAKANKRLKFNKLKAGTYYYRIYAHTADKQVITVLDKKFTVKKASKKKKNTAKSAVSATPYELYCNYPANLVQGTKYSIGGKILCSDKISQVTIGVVNAKTCKWTAQKYTADVGARSFNVSKADTSIKFGTLEQGLYRYKILAKVGNKTYTLINKKFEIVAAEDNDTSQYAEVTSVRAQDGISTTNSVTLSDNNLPSKYKVGKKMNAVGTIKSKETIQRVEIGIVFAPTGKWTSHKYDNDNVESNTFDIAEASSKLSFGTLPGGTYLYRIYVHSESGVTLVLDHKFEVKASDKAQKAVDWAIDIANNDEFSYGKKPKTSKAGCYFCGTNQKKKPKGYEKTYVCLTFVEAAYAHGANDPEMLKDCKAGKCHVAASELTLSYYTCWEKIGLAKDLKVEDLLPGDVIVYYSPTGYSNGHVAMYAGGNNIVDAQGIKDCWGPNSIALRNNAASALKAAAKFHSKSFVMRYRY